jgi:DNA polymerase V
MVWGLKRLWQPNTMYKKAGVVLDGLETASQQQLSLFACPNRGEVRAQLMQELDRLNQRFGADTVGFATALPPYGKHQVPWMGRRTFLSTASFSRAVRRAAS